MTDVSLLVRPTLTGDGDLVLETGDADGGPLTSMTIPADVLAYWAEKSALLRKGQVTE